MGIRHQRHLVRHHIKHQHDELLLRITLDVELGGYDIPDIIYITVPDMPFIRPRVYGDPFGTESLAPDGSLFHIGYIASPCIPYCGNLVDVDTQSCHGSNHAVSAGKGT